MKARYSYFICLHIHSMSKKREGGLVNLADLRHRMRFHVSIDYRGHRDRVWDTVMTAIDWLIVDLSAGEPGTNYLSYYSIGANRLVCLNGAMDYKEICSVFGTHGDLLVQGGE